MNYLNKELEKYGEKALLVYGGGFIKKNGIYDKIIKKLKECNKEVVELPGVMSNPTLDKLNEGIKLAREME